MSVLTSNMMGGHRDSLFSFSLHDEPSYCSELSWDSDGDDSDSDDSFISEDDDYLDAQMMKGDFILEKPLEVNDLDRMFDWGFGYKAPSKFKESVYDFAVKVPIRRHSITDDDTSSFGDDEIRSDAFGSVLSAMSNELESNEMDGAELIADSAYVSNSSTLDDRWTEGRTHENLSPRVNRWRGGLTPDKNLRPSIERPMMPPPRRRPSNSGDDWNAMKRHSIESSSLQFEVIKSQIQSELGLRMSDSLPAQKIMEAIMSVLQNPGCQEESKEESKYDQ
ncbi:unnamed protein product [Cylindrotheca closterium]|uniref:Uncharacterized protein n=1 Tax=Cylindrotheca closterium TaxID=2856 RepID=A0AAD2FCP3_9STRA|nr:unnamed protein product [Cylindrotheca closterium]